MAGARNRPHDPVLCGSVPCLYTTTTGFPYTRNMSVDTKVRWVIYMSDPTQTLVASLMW